MSGVEYIAVSEADRLPLRVAVAPFFSLLMATRDAAGAQRSGTPDSWCRAIRAQLSDRDYTTLAPLSTPARVNVPDAIVPFPAPPGESLRDAFERIMADEDSLVRDMHACVASGRTGDWTGPARDPRRWVRGFIAALARAWNGFEPIWSTAQDSLVRETERVALAGANGAQRHVLADLLPHARLTTERWEIEGFAEHDIGYGVRPGGLVLMPTVAGELASAVVHDQTTMSHVAYPIRALRRPSPGSLVALLGAPRARILLALDRPASNSRIAEALRTLPSTATHHVSALETAGLVVRDRSGRQVMVRRTARGEALIALYDGA